MAGKIPSNLPNILSSLRSSIFQTLSNPTSARTGSKYLRRRLVGPSLIKYYPKLPSLRVLNSATPFNPYANWEGLPAGLFQQRAVAKDGTPGQTDKWGEMSWRSREQMLVDPVEKGWQEVTRVRGAGWVDDARERLRAEEVQVKRAAGKGPPKKGEPGV
jgi:hypothetical protein